METDVPTRSGRLTSADTPQDTHNGSVHARTDRNAPRLGASDVEAAGRDPRLDSATQLATWTIKVLPDCGEATFVGAAVGGTRKPREPGAATIDPVRSRQESERRAKTAVRRYATANRLNRLFTFTYRGEGQHDYKELCSDMNAFVKRLRYRFKNKAFPYVWVAELHPGGHGWHVHMCIGRYVLKATLAEVWGHGFVDAIEIKAKGDERRKYRVAASYVSKYVSKAMDTVPNRQRYKVAEGFPPREQSDCVQAVGSVAVHHVSEFYFGGRTPKRVWCSSEVGDDWHGPPIMVAFYD